MGRKRGELLFLSGNDIDMKTKINKTNAVRLLDKAKIDYELIPYEVDENDLAAAHVAAQLGENIEQVFKTLVLHGDRGGYFVCVIPGDHELDLNTTMMYQHEDFLQAIQLVEEKKGSYDHIVITGVNHDDTMEAVDRILK